MRPPHTPSTEATMRAELTGVILITVTPFDERLGLAAQLAR